MTRKVASTGYDDRLIGCRATLFASALSAALGLGFGLSQGSVAVQAAPIPNLAQPPIARAPIVPVAVFGSDDRTTLPPQRRALAEKLGVLIDLERKTVCTAFCVGEATVMTAGHCLKPAGPRDKARLSDFRFRKDLLIPGNDARIAGASKGGGAQSIAIGTSRLSLRPPIDAVKDWAIVRLDRNVCPTGGLTLSRRSSDEIMELASERRIYQVAFHRDFQYFKLAWAQPCDVARGFNDASWDTISRDFEAPESVLLHTCDTGGSSSGSPLLIDGASGPEVVGLNVGTYLQSSVTAPLGSGTGAISSAATRSRDIANTAIAAHTIAPLVDEFSRAEILLDPRRVRDVAAWLSGLGLYSRPHDGRYGPALKTAIEAYEFSEGLPVTGLLTKSLWQRLAQQTRSSQNLKSRENR